MFAPVQVWTFWGKIIFWPFSGIERWIGQPLAYKQYGQYECCLLQYMALIGVIYGTDWCNIWH
jgi:hypothetical protein